MRLQAPVNLLIIPKKEIHTINEVSEEDTIVLGKLFLIAKILAKEQGISESTYRLTMKSNEDVGQSVFSLHLYLLGGKTLGLIGAQETKRFTNNTPKILSNNENYRFLQISIIPRE